MGGLAREQIEAVDRHGFVGDVLAMPQHLEDVPEVRDWTLSIAG